MGCFRVVIILKITTLSETTSNPALFICESPPLPLENTKGQLELDCSRLFEFPSTKFSRDNRFPLHFFLPFLLFSLGFIAFDLCAFSISEKNKCCGLDLNSSGRRLCVDRILMSGYCLVGIVNFLFRRYLQLISPCLVTYIFSFTCSF